MTQEQQKLLDTLYETLAKMQTEKMFCNIVQDRRGEFEYHPKSQGSHDDRIGISANYPYAKR